LAITQQTAIDLATLFRNAADCESTPQLTEQMYMDKNIVGIFSGNQAGKCVTIITKISTPSGEKTIGELYMANSPFKVYAWDGKKKVIAQASQPFRKEGKHKCYELGMDNGQIIQLADKHLVLTSHGWIHVDKLPLIFPDLVQSSSDTSHKVPLRDVLHSNGIASNSQDHYFGDPDLSGGQLLSDPDNDLSSFPLQDDAQRHIISLCEMGGQGNKYTNILSLKYDLHSILDVLAQTSALFFEGLSHSLGKLLKYVGLNNRLAQISTGGSFRQSLPSYEFYQPANLAASFLDLKTLCYSFCKSYLFGSLKKLVLSLSKNKDVSQSLPISEFGQCQKHDDLLLACDSPSFGLLGDNKIEYIRPITRSQTVYDFTVEEHHNYFAGGLIHHNTFGVAYNYFLRILGIHPVERLNHLARKIRCLSPSLPQPGGMEDQENTQYIEFKRLLPPELIEKDITARSMNMIIRRPDGSKTVLMFNSTNQEMQKLGRIQLSSCWHDEESPKAIREESKMRLLSEGGDEIFSLTPTNALSYTYDEVWLRAECIFRTPTIQKKFNLPEWEYPNKNTRVGVIQMATDDNPTLDPETIDFLFEDITDPDDLVLRRYGVFRQISGRIHKTYSPAECYIDLNKYFGD